MIFSSATSEISRATALTLPRVPEAVPVCRVMLPLSPAGASPEFMVTVPLSPEVAPLEPLAKVTLPPFAAGRTAGAGRQLNIPAVACVATCAGAELCETALAAAVAIAGDHIHAAALKIRPAVACNDLDIASNSLRVAGKDVDLAAVGACLTRFSAGAGLESPVDDARVFTSMKPDEPLLLVSPVAMLIAPLLPALAPPVAMPICPLFAAVSKGYAVRKNIETRVAAAGRPASCQLYSAAFASAIPYAGIDVNTHPVIAAAAGSIHRVVEIPLAEKVRV
jgi:hypothetical protein